MPARINLLSKENITATKLGRVSTWALTKGRWIVIVTELIVIAAFLARFKLDRDIANLTDEITQKSAVIDAYASTEKTFKETQKRLQVLNDALSEQRDYYQILIELENSLPSEVAITSLTFQENSMLLKGIALTESAMAGFEQQLKQSPYFAGVGLTRVDSEQTQVDQFEFELKAQIIQ